MPQEDLVIKQLSEMRKEARRVGSRVAEDALSHAIASGAVLKRRAVC